MEEEMRFHLEEHIEMLMEEGMSHEEARKAALREFGNEEALKEECRDSWGIRLAEATWRHLDFSWRQIQKTKSVTLMVVLTLALGIGVNTAIFSLANSFLFAPLDFPEFEQLITIDERTDQLESMSISYQNFLDWKERQTSFSAMGVWKNEGYNLAGPEGAERISGSIVSHDLFQALQLKPIIGRLFTEEDDQPGAALTVIMSEPFWQTRFAGDPAILGTTVRLTDELYTVVGVVPSLSPLDSGSLWSPIAPVAERFSMQNRGSHSLMGIARMKEGVNVEQARSELKVIAAQLAEEYPATNSNVAIKADLTKDYFMKEAGTALFSLLGASGFLLLIACANVANVQLVNSNRRSHEFGIRTSLGASRRQIVGQLAVESLTLGIMGGLVGMVVAYLSIEWLKATFQTQVPGVERVSINATVLSYCVLASCLSSFLFGLAPLRQILRSSKNEALKADSKTSDSRDGKRWKTTLIVGEFVLTCVLLIGAGLMIRTTYNLYQSNPGFKTQQRLTCLWSIPRTDAYDSQKRARLAEEAQQALQNIPGIRSVGIAYPLPLSNSASGNTYYVDGAVIPAHGRTRTTESICASNEYFSTMNIPLVSGRYFNEFDTADSPRVAIVDTKFVAQNFPNEDPLGKRITYGSNPPSDPKRWMEIVGIVEHVYIRGVKQNTREQMYRPIKQSPPGRLAFIMETEGTPMANSNTVRKVLSDLNPNLAVQSMETLETAFKKSAIVERVFMQLLTFLAGMGLLMAAVGLYGVMSFTVGQQTREIGIRMAIGADQRSIRSQILINGAKLAGLGLGIGLIVSLALSRLIRGLLYGVPSFDWLSFAIVTIILTVVGLIACWLPAYRATRIAPISALRAE